MTERHCGEASAAFVPLKARVYQDAAAQLEYAAQTLGDQQNNFAAVAARRELIELCVRIADEHGHEVRHDAR